MAGTSQSAVNYIKTTRTRLEGGLQNLSVIVEDLHKGEVFTEEEVSKIQTEKDDVDKTRTILDWVTYKGEAACYELLKIIDKTKSTLGPELLQWISCFPFKEDVEMDINYSEGAGPCHRYQAKLKKKAVHLSDVWKQSNSFQKSNSFLGLPKYKYSNLTYTPLVLDTHENEKTPHKNKRMLLFKSKKEKKTKKTRSKKLKTCIPEDEHEISIDDLLKTRKNKLLLVGKPGIGKTTAACQMLKMWGGSNNKDLDYMFYFDMKIIPNPVNLADLLDTFSELDEAREEVLEDMRRNSEKVTIIFDGLTDLSSSVIQKLVDGDLLPDAKIIIICRPEDESEDFLYDWASLRVEVKGFSKKSIREYLANMLNSEQLSNVQNNLELFSLCHVPAYALMVVACFSITNSMATQEPCTLTEIYLKILCSCIEKHSGKNITKNNLDNYIQEYSEATSDLAQAALDATKGKYLNIPDLPCEITCVYSPILNTVNVKVQLESTGWKPQSAFLHYTIQEFFAALSFLKNPAKITELLLYCLTEEKKYMKHLIPFLCGLCSKKSLDMLKCLAPDKQVKEISKSFIIDVVNTFLSSPLNQDHSDTDDSNILFLCKCLYESQSTEACLHFLDKLDFCLDLSEENLDPHHYCAVSYVISQSQERKIQLKLGDTLSAEGLSLILGCLKNIQLDGCDTLKSQLWKALFLSEEEMDYSSLLVLGGNELHLPASCGKRQVFERAVKVMQNSPERVHLCLLWDGKTSAYADLRWTLLESVPQISKLSFRDLKVQECFLELLEGEEKKLLLDLCLDAAINKRKVFQSTVNTLLSLFSVYTTRYDILLDLYLHISSKGYKHIIPILKPLYPPDPTVWSIDLSERKVSVLLECLKLQPEKKHVELRGWSDEENEVKIFLQCLPYISQLRFTSSQSGHRFLMNLCMQAVLHERLNTQTIEQVFSLSEYWSHKWDFILDLYSHVKDYETETHQSVFPAFQRVDLPAPTVWSIDLSERKVSLLLEMLKLQPVKKPVELRGWSDEESEVKVFLQCLPYISKLRFTSQNQTGHRFLMNLCVQAAQSQRLNTQTIKDVFSVSEYWSHKWDLLLDLYSHVKDYETQTHKSVLPALQPVYQSAPTVWSIDLSERKVSLLLEMLKLQPEKKPVELRGWSDDESEVRIFLQCLPYISKLRFTSQNQTGHRFLMNLCVQAAQSQRLNTQTIEDVFSVSEYWHHNWDFILDLYSYVKDYETQTGRSVLPALQPVYQSAPTVWSIDLSERKVSLLLEILKLQPEKKPVELRGWSDEESEVRIFLQCLPYISKLRFTSQNQTGHRFLMNLCVQAVIHERLNTQTIEQVFSLSEYWSHKWDFILDLYSYVKDYETQTRKSVLPALQPVYQSAPTVWSIDLSERKVSLLLEVLKLQPEKKPVELRGWSDEESEVRIFLQCLPYISKLRLCESMVLLLFRSVRAGRLPCPVAIEELSLLKTTPQSERLLSRVVSNVASLLRHWSVRCLDLTKSSIHSYLLLPLLSHHDQLTIKLCPEVLQELAGVVFTAQDEDLAKSFLEKVGGDLTSCSLDREVLLYLLQQSSDQMFTVDLRKNRISERNITGLLPFLDRVVFKRPSPRFTLGAIRETYKCRSSSYVSSLLRSLEYVINLNNTELDTVDCDALLFTLKHCDKVTELSLLWTSIPPEAVKNILYSLDKVSHLSVDRSLLLAFLHCCTTCQTQQGAAGMLRALQYRLDLSCSSSVDLSEQQQVVSLSLTVTHCRDISTVLGHSSSQDTQLILSDCEVEDSGLDLLFPVLNRVHLRCSKPLLLQLLSLVFVGSERNTVMRAGSLAGALGGELDLSETRLDQKACRCLALVLEHSEGLTELDLSHSQLTDQLLETLIPHLHKAHVLDLSHNQLTDALTERLLQLLSINTSIHTVRLFNNCFVDTSPFLKDKRFEIWSTNQQQALFQEDKCVMGNMPLHGEMETDGPRISGCRMGESSSLPRSRSLPSLSQIPFIENEASFRAKRSHSLNDVTLLDKTQKITPDVIVAENKESYTFHCSQLGLFQCSVTGLVFKMVAEGDVTYRTVPWNRRLLAQHGKRPAGPLFDIKCTQRSVRQLHLPHCQILSMGRDRSLSVAHVMDEEIELIRPDVITETHVIINVTGFSAYGNVTDADSQSPIEALVLLFYIPPIADDPHSFLKVLLLPMSVVLREVLNERGTRHPEEIYIVTPSCDLIPNQKYTLSTSPTDDSIIIQPREKTFKVDESSYKNYIDTFQVIFKGGIRDHVTVCLKDSNTSDCALERYVCLSAPFLRNQQVKQTLSDSPKDRLFSCQSSFITSVSHPTLSWIIDKLYEKRVLNESEQDATKDMRGREDKARFVITTVRKKGPDASSSMILILCDIDPQLAKHLKLIC